MSGVTLYVSGKAKKLRTLPELIRGETLNAMRRGQQRVRRAAAEGLRLRSIGRALFGRKVSGAYKHMKREKVSEQPAGLFHADLKVFGIAQIQEQGGPIKPHTVKRGGKVWRHPGVKAMPRFPFLDHAVSSQRGVFKVEIDKGVAKVAEIVNRG